MGMLKPLCESRLSVRYHDGFLCPGTLNVDWFGVLSEGTLLGVERSDNSTDLA